MDGVREGKGPQWTEEACGDQGLSEDNLHLAGPSTCSKPQGSSAYHSLTWRDDIKEWTGEKSSR